MKLFTIETVCHADLRQINDINMTFVCRIDAIFFPHQQNARISFFKQSQNSMANSVYRCTNSSVSFYKYQNCLRLLILFAETEKYRYCFVKASDGSSRLYSTFILIDKPLKKTNIVNVSVPSKVFNFTHWLSIYQS